MRRALLLTVLLCAFAVRGAGASEPTQNPFFQDPLGPISDVTNDWQQYQPAETFCVRTNVFTVPADTDATATADDPVCQFSGYHNGETGLYKFSLSSLKDAEGNPLSIPALCNGCRRIFIDFSRIPANDPTKNLYYAHGHAYYRYNSYNFGYYADPYAHSPNTKNFTNDKLVVPQNSPQQSFVEPFDTHGMEYVTDTANFAHASSQGPWYIGPWYVNESGERINGVYLDINVASAGRLGGPGIDEIWYQSGFNDDSNQCLDGQLGRPDGNYFYGGCFNHFGGSSYGVDPWQ